ncbi:MAG: alpha/beta hydrolase [Spongiibacteraceae bacterium]
MKVRKFQSDDVEIVASELGDPNHSAVVFLHGAGQTRYAWRNTAQILADTGYYVLALDLRGHGDSDWSSKGDYSSDAFIADLKVVIGQLGSPPVLIGASLGGLVSLLTVGETSEPMAKALLMVDVTPKVDMDARGRIIGFMQSNQLGFADAEEAATAVSAYLPHRPKPKNPSGLMRNLRKQEDGRYYWHWDPMFFDSPNATHNDPESRYSAAALNIHVPTLLIRGEHSDLVTEESVKHFLSLIPDAEYVDVFGAHHMLVGDKNDAFTQSILDFLDRQAVGQSAFQGE